MSDVGYLADRALVELRAAAKSSAAPERQAHLEMAQLYMRQYFQQVPTPPERKRARPS